MQLTRRKRSHKFAFERPIPPRIQARTFVISAAPFAFLIHPFHLRPLSPSTTLARPRCRSSFIPSQYSENGFAMHSPVFHFANKPLGSRWKGYRVVSHCDDSQSMGSSLRRRISSNFSFDIGRHEREAFVLFVVPCTPSPLRL